MLAQLDERGKAENVNRPGHKTTWTAAELLTTDFQRPPFVVDGLLLAGLTMLGGRPKIGKSLACAATRPSRGYRRRLSGQSGSAGAVPVLALEDPPWRLADRMRAQNWQDAAALVDFQTVGSLRAGAGEELAAMIRGECYKLVIIDTLARRWPATRTTAGP